MGSPTSRLVAAVGSLLLACGGGQRRPEPDAASVDAGAKPDGAVDAGVDSGADAALPYPECDPFLFEWSRTIVDSTFIDRNDVEVEVVTVEVSDSHMLLEGDRQTYGPDAPRLQVEFVPPDGRQLRLPAVGEPVIVLGGTCNDNISSGYARIMTLDHVLLWEGGDPFCTTLPGSYPWTAAPLLGVREHPDAATCVDRDEWDTPLPPREGCCCMTRTEMEVFLTAEGAPAVVPGADLQVEIDGRAYVAASVGEAAINGGPCIWDIDGTTGGGYVALLAP